MGKIGVEPDIMFRKEFVIAIFHTNSISMRVDPMFNNIPLEVSDGRFIETIDDIVLTYNQIVVENYANISEQVKYMYSVISHVPCTLFIKNYAHVNMLNNITDEFNELNNECNNLFETHISYKNEKYIMTISGYIEDYEIYKNKLNKFVKYNTNSQFLVDINLKIKN